MKTQHNFNLHTLWGPVEKNDPKLSFDTTFYFGLLAINDKGYAENSRLTNSTFLKKLEEKN